ncbi:uncharacterized protein SAPINGB_P002168 [Magnusiomyces paraingens]|uniref:Adenylate kinase isoenzyme 6 homolog n=1 Tax=Magnusiomyces paraingens TaxID=2606893 RepID=A0A5E8BDW0_9ASCO|nr:uncharacterized protein SAPINGB_P002168 [Saprochaete ingens]VVT49232.1 unnamed protein product [Saprochaete ingens]
MAQRKPNIIVTGTPGTGKTSHAQQIAEQMPDLKYYPINDVAKARDCIVGYDEERQSSIVDEEKLLDAIEEELEAGGLVIDWHVCDIFPERLIDLVLVLRTSTNLLYDRYVERKYPENKRDENMDAEIMQIILDEARDSYDENIVIELQSDTIEDLESNVERVVEWRKHWDSNNEDK